VNIPAPASIQNLKQAVPKICSVHYHYYINHSSKQTEELHTSSTKTSDKLLLTSETWHLKLLLLETVKDNFCLPPNPNDIHLDFKKKKPKKNTSVTSHCQVSFPLHLLPLVWGRLLVVQLLALPTVHFTHPAVRDCSFTTIDLRSFSPITYLWWVHC